MEATAGEKTSHFPEMGHLQAVTESPEYWPTILQFIQATE